MGLAVQGLAVHLEFPHRVPNTVSTLLKKQGHKKKQVFMRSSQEFKISHKKVILTHCKYMLIKMIFLNI